MDISRLLNVYSTPTPGGSASGATATAPEPSSEGGKAGPAGISAERSREIRDIVSQYDLSDISPNEFSELVKKLQEAGAISTSDVQELAQIRLELEQDGADPHESLDLIKFFQDKLQSQEKELRKQESAQPGLAVDRQQALQDVLRQIDWVQKLAAVDSRASFESLDAVG